MVFASSRRIRARFPGSGILYAWGVIQAHLAEKNLANPTSLSMIGATSAFFVAFACLPVSRKQDRYEAKRSADTYLDRESGFMDDQSVL